ncbi:MAG TPA: transposase family protein [Streptosporangiaceae bacterium]
MSSSPIAAARSQYLLDLLAQVPDPRKRRGRRHPLAGLLAVGVAAVIAGSRSFAAIGQAIFRSAVGPSEGRNRPGKGAKIVSGDRWNPFVHL